METALLRMRATEPRHDTQLFIAGPLATAQTHIPSCSVCCLAQCVHDKMRKCWTHVKDELIKNSAVLTFREGEEGTAKCHTSAFDVYLSC